jgi:hypothetical protein
MACRTLRLQEFSARGPAARSRRLEAPRRRRRDHPRHLRQEPQEPGERALALLGRSRRLEAPRRRKPARPRRRRREPREPGERAPVLPGRSRRLEAPRRRKPARPRHLGSAGPGRGPSRRCQLRSGRWPPAEAPRFGKATNGAWQGPRVTTPSWERNLSLAAGGAQRCALFLELDSWSWVVDGLNLGTALSALAA